MNLDEVLEHHGVKGMKWGVRKASKTVKTASSKAVKSVRTRVREEVKSSKRELSWSKKLNSLSTMSTKELQKNANRVKMENDMKRYIKDTRIRNRADLKQLSKDKKAYRNREKISDKDLSAKVEKLKLQRKFRMEVSRATKTYRDRTNKLIDDHLATNEDHKLYAAYGKSIVDFSTGKY